MKIRELLTSGSRMLQDREVDNGVNEAKYLLEWAMNQDYSYLLLHLDAEVSPEAEKRYQDAICRRQQHVPLQQITGCQEFMGYPFYVNEHVLIPRQDTEILVETVWKRMLEDQRQTDWKVLDLCCGSGCIGLSLYKLYKEKQPGKSIRLTLADISPEALQVTERNRQQLEVPAELIESDLFDTIKDRFSIIVSNPPYIPTHVIEELMPEVRDHEPHLALDGDSDGLRYYRRITEAARNYLEDEGYLYYEIGYDQAQDVREILVDAGYDQIEIIQDLAGLDRVVLGRWPGKQL